MSSVSSKPPDIAQAMLGRKWSDQQIIRAIALKRLRDRSLARLTFLYHTDKEWLREAYLQAATVLLDEKGYVLSKRNRGPINQWSHDFCAVVLDQYDDLKYGVETQRRLDND